MISLIEDLVEKVALDPSPEELKKEFVEKILIYISN
jgi:hypothetical protein